MGAWLARVSPHPAGMCCDKAAGLTGCSRRDNSPLTAAAHSQASQCHCRIRTAAGCYRATAVSCPIGQEGKRVVALPSSPCRPRPSLGLSRLKLIRHHCSVHPKLTLGSSLLLCIDCLLDRLASSILPPSSYIRTLPRTLHCLRPASSIQTRPPPLTSKSQDPAASRPSSWSGTSCCRPSHDGCGYRDACDNIRPLHIKGDRLDSKHSLSP